MKLHDLIFPFTPKNKRPATCHTRVYQTPELGLVVINSEMKDNPGTSITNAAEELIDQQCKRFQIDPEGAVFLEHYPSVDSPFKFERNKGERFDRVRIINNTAVWEPFPTAHIPTSIIRDFTTQEEE